MSNKIETYIFFDLETTGLPWEEKNRTKITEISFIAAGRKDISSGLKSFDVRPLTFLLNPNREISEVVTKLTGLSNDILINEPTFQDKFPTIYEFLDSLPKPACLVAHNGNTFDFKILLAECNDIRKELPSELLCVDSLIGFRKILNNNASKKTESDRKPSNSSSNSYFNDVPVVIQRKKARNSNTITDKSHLILNNFTNKKNTKSHVEKGYTNNISKTNVQQFTKGSITLKHSEIPGEVAPISNASNYINILSSGVNDLSYFAKNDEDKCSIANESNVLVNVQNHVENNVLPKFDIGEDCQSYDIEGQDDPWPELDISKEDWDDIDEICSSLSDMSDISQNYDSTSVTKEDKIPGNESTTIITGNEHCESILAIKESMPNEDCLDNQITPKDKDSPGRKQCKTVIKGNLSEKCSMSITNDVLMEKHTFTSDKSALDKMQKKQNITETKDDHLTVKQNTSLTKPIQNNFLLPKSFKLGDIYQSLTNKSAVNAHRAEADCIMLLDSVLCVKDDFIEWADQACKPLKEIKPLVRYR